MLGVSPKRQLLVLLSATDLAHHDQAGVNADAHLESGLWKTGLPSYVALRRSPARRAGSMVARGLNPRRFATPPQSPTPSARRAAASSSWAVG